MATTTTLALAVLLTFTQEEATPPQPPAEASMEAPSPAESPDDVKEEVRSGKQKLSRITLKDGQQLHGVVVHRDTQTVVVELAAGGRMELPAHLVKSVEDERNAQVRDNGEVWFQDPNRTRYLYAPSAMMLRQGEGYVSQKELFFSSVSYGLTDNVTLQAGAILPLWLAGENGFNVIGGVKIGGSLTDRLHLAGGAQALVVPTYGAMGFLFGTATYGTPDAHLSLAVGAPFTLVQGSSSIASQVITTLSGNVRMSQRLALVTENWLMPAYISSNSELPMLNSLALRIFGQQWAVDIGAVRVPGAPFPIPWLDFAYNFG